jgi:hemerythrin-like domain-containing protein
MTTLTDTVHEHHATLIPQVDALLDTARMVGTVPCEELRPRVLETRLFLSGTLLPHMEAAERSIYPRLESALSDTGALAPLRREHEEVRRLAADLDRLCDANREGAYHRGAALALRRALYRIHAIVRVHLDEEEMLTALLAHSIDADEAASISNDLAHAVAIPL